jgi:hypothetical protein
MALTNAEKQAAWRQRREQRVKELEAEIERLRRQLARQATKTPAVIQLDWEIDPDGEYVSAYEEPCGLYVTQCADTFSWQLVEDAQDDEDGVTEIAQGNAPSLVAAMAAAEAARRETVKKAALKTKSRMAPTDAVRSRPGRG